MLALLGGTVAWAHELQVATALAPTWKETGPVTKKKQSEASSGSWQPQAQPAPKED